MRIMILFLCICLCPVPAAALEIEAPQIPSEYSGRMPSDTEDLAGGLLEIISDTIQTLRPDLHEAVRISVGILAAVLVVSVVQTFSASAQPMTETTGVIVIAMLLLSGTGAMIRLAVATVDAMV